MTAQEVNLRGLLWTRISSERLLKNAVQKWCRTGDHRPEMSNSGSFLHVVLCFSTFLFGWKFQLKALNSAPFEALDFEVFQGMCLSPPPPSKGRHAKFHTFGYRTNMLTCCIALVLWLPEPHVAMVSQVLSILDNSFIHESRPRPRMYMLVWTMPMVRLLSVYFVYIHFPFFFLKICLN